MADVMICVASAQVEVEAPDGTRLEWVRAERTTAHADHPVVVKYPHLWAPLPINYPTYAEGGIVPASGGEAAVLQPGEVVLTGSQQAGIADAVAAVGDPAADDGAPEPAAKDVRAWAAENEIEVNARGPIPDDIVDQYKAAQAEQDEQD